MGIDQAITKSKPDAIQKEIKRLDGLLELIGKEESVSIKISMINLVPEVKAFPFATYFKKLSLSKEEEYVLKATFAIKQGQKLFTPLFDEEKIKILLDDLVNIERFYKDSGGIVGYQHLVLHLLSKQKQDTTSSLHPPKGIDLGKETKEVRSAIIEAIASQDLMVEFYPVGGAADRLQLKDEETQKGLPAAHLIFLGKHLLQGVVHDLQAREYLAFKLFNKQVLTPIAMMTSRVNHNHELIQEICKENQWFDRPKNSFKFFKQPRIPVFTKQGDWCLEEPLKLLLKPGGHGVLWNLALKAGVFDWFYSLGKTKALVRQINNPMAAIDYGLLAFLGIGHQKNKSFGFASCPRLVDAHEGMNVLKRSVNQDKTSVILTNIEYCDFGKFGIEDKPQVAGGRYSHFPSNTNILFADLKKIEEAAEKNLFPGLIVNFREASHCDKDGNVKVENIARVESTMQNIADSLEIPMTDEDVTEKLPSYLTFNERRKTISTTKQASCPKGTMLETVEGCYYDFMQNAKELLEEHCQITLPSVPNEKAFLEEGPSFLFSYHPALGPLYSIIGQKLKGGQFSEGSELQLEIADIEIKNLDLKGSLLIHADQIMGHLDQEKHLCYSHQTGQCILKNVKVENKGIDWNEDHLFWKHEIAREASLKIVLKGHSQFIAENITLKGNLTIEVPHNTCIIAKEEKGKLVFEEKAFKKKSPFWNYHVTEDHEIVLSK